MNIANYDDCHCGGNWIGVTGSLSRRMEAAVCGAVGARGRGAEANDADDDDEAEAARASYPRQGDRHACSVWGVR